MPTTPVHCTAVGAWFCNAVTPVAVYRYDTARAGDPANYYHPKDLENEVPLPEENNLADCGRPDIGPSRAWSGKPKHLAGLGGETSRLGGTPPPGRKEGGRLPAVLMQDGAIYAGEKGYMATVGRGEGVQLPSAARWGD